MSSPWIGFDLDGTLAYHYWPHLGQFDELKIGEPVPPMIDLVKSWLQRGVPVKIFTARVAPNDDGSPRPNLAQITAAIDAWSLKNIGQTLPITCIKDRLADLIYDDIAIGVVRDKGILLNRAAQ